MAEIVDARRVVQAEDGRVVVGGYASLLGVDPSHAGLVAQAHGEVVGAYVGSEEHHETSFEPCLEADSLPVGRRGVRAEERREQDCSPREHPLAHGYRTAPPHGLRRTRGGRKARGRYGSYQGRPLLL